MRLTIKDPISKHTVSVTVIESVDISDGVLHTVTYEAKSSSEVDCTFAVIEHEGCMVCQSDWQSTTATPDDIADYNWLDCTPDDDQEECSITEAAEMLGVSRQRVHQLIQSGLVEARKIGKTWCVSVASVRHRVH